MNAFKEDLDSCFMADRETNTKNNVLPATDAGTFRTPGIYQSTFDLNLKIQDYVPPMKEELQEQFVTVDTYGREMILPQYFYNYFTDTFMIPSYTCDKQGKDTGEALYPGSTQPYTCYCNEGDFHTMPTINIVIADSKDPFQYNVDPAYYMFRPYLTNEVSPATECMFGIES